MGMYIPQYTATARGDELARMAGMCFAQIKESVTQIVATIFRTTLFASPWPAVNMTRNVTTCDCSCAKYLRLCLRRGPRR